MLLAPHRDRVQDVLHIPFVIWANSGGHDSHVPAFSQPRPNSLDHTRDGLAYVGRPVFVPIPADVVGESSVKGPPRSNHLFASFNPFWVDFTSLS